MLTAGPTVSLGRRGEVAAGELAAGFVDGAGREGEDVADGDGLVEGVEAGGGADGAECTDAAGVLAVDVVEAVAGAELVAGVDVVVDFGEEVVGVDGVGVEAGGDLRALVADGLEAGVDGGDVGRGDGDEAGLIELLALEVGEVEGAVAEDGAGEAGSVLGLGDGELALGEGVGGVEALVAEVAVEGSVERVGCRCG